MKKNVGKEMQEIKKLIASNKCEQPGEEKNLEERQGGEEEDGDEGKFAEMETKLCQMMEEKFTEIKRMVRTNKQSGEETQRDEMKIGEDKVEEREVGGHFHSKTGNSGMAGQLVSGTTYYTSAILQPIKKKNRKLDQGCFSERWILRMCIVLYLENTFKGQP